jgi:pSer/pThr/pTyr-binding forkhead associated (FHA) protein
MSPAALALLLALVIGIALALGLALLQGKRPAICSQCGRPRVAGRTSCPHCGTPYEEPRPRRDRSRPPPRPEAPCLVGLEGPESGRRFQVAEETFSLGRGVDNQLRLAGRFVSRRHALIIFQNGQYVLRDRDSTNGTYVNGQRVGEYVLRSGDRIQIGPSVLEFQLPDALPKRSATLVHSPPRSPLPPSSLPIPRFRDYVITPLKQGGAAVIYKGVRRDGQQTVAIKVLRHTDRYLRQKFADEARVLRALNHPHIAKAYESGHFDGFSYFVMEYCDGGNLRDRLLGGRPLPMNFVVSVIGQTCRALDYAHRHGVIHRDLKPENIMFTARDYVKIVDFGIAKWTGRITRTVDGMVIGTPFYLSYEQARGLPVDPRSDIYSLGVVLYEMVTGRVPFQGQALEVIRKHLTELPPPPRRFNPSLRPEIEQVVLQALHKDRRQRFQSAQELAAAVGYQR